MKLEGKVAFVTGFGSGLGQAIAVLFAKEGAAVAGTSTTEAKGRDTVAMIEKAGRKALFRPGDVSNSEQMKALIDDTVKQFGGLDIVVNSAGVRTNGSITEITEEQWDRTIDVNLKGVFVVSRLAIPEMIKRGGGVILNIGARSGMAGQAGRAAYCASKGGMTTLTEAMAMDFAAHKTCQLHLSRANEDSDGRYIDAGTTRALQETCSHRPDRGAGRYRLRSALPRV
jgi:NAD(P)-dependent dehydrogenase (short-subunit alcohol dehydrogenase family)